MPVFGVHTTQTPRRPAAVATMRVLVAWGERTSQEILLTSAAATLVERPDLATSDDTIRARANYLLSLGGDGCILNSARLIAGTKIAILGVNLGSLGFLTESLAEELERDLDRLLADSFIIEERFTLATIFEDLTIPPALNDVVVDRGSVSRMIGIDLFADGAPVSSYSADGLIIATQTGSTAYSLSAGGPILAPGLKAIVASPISPFGFASRPIVFPESAVLDICSTSNHGYSTLTIDGQFTVNLPALARFTVRRSPHTVRLVRFPGSSFYDTLRRKLHWGKPPESR